MATVVAIRESRFGFVNPSVKRSVWSWAFYDWANSAYATTVMAGFFPLFFKGFWASDLAATQSTYVLGLCNSISSFAMALLAPILGSLADHGLGKKRLLLWFTILGSGATSALFWVEQGDWSGAAIIYGVSSFAFSGAMVFYDSLLVDVSRPERFDMDSSLGYALGYLGGGVLFTLNVLMYLKPEFFGLASGADGVRWSFLSVGVWWLLFSLPLMAYVREKWAPSERPPLRQILFSGWRSLMKTFRRLRHHRPLLLFLGAYVLYGDAVNTIIKMAVDYGMALGFSPQHLITALLVVQFVGFPAAVAFGFIAQRWTAKTGVFICLGVYILITILAYFMSQSWHFYALAAAIGLVQGGIQALSRSLYARMIPSHEAGEFFGFFNFLGKFSAIIGPLLMGIVSQGTGNPRHSIFVIMLLFFLGGWLLSKVDARYQVAN